MIEPKMTLEEFEKLIMRTTKIWGQLDQREKTIPEFKALFDYLKKEKESLCSDNPKNLSVTDEDRKEILNILIEYFGQEPNKLRNLKLSIEV